MLLDNIHIFIQVVDNGSFTKAAENLNLYQSTISRKIQQLEDNLGVQLFVRNSKRMELTAKGKFFYQELRESVIELVEKTKSATLSNELSGELRMIIPPFIILNFMQVEVADFIRIHDKLNVEIFTSFTDLNNMQHPFDLGITPFFPNINYYTSRKLFNASLGLYATPRYLYEYGNPLQPKDLESHRVFIPKFGNILLNKWNMKDVNDKEYPVEINPAFVYDSTLVAETLVLNDVGISLLFDRQVTAKLAEGLLVRVLPEYHFKEMGFYLIKPNNIRNPKIDLFIDFLQKKNPQLFGKPQ